MGGGLHPIHTRRFLRVDFLVGWSFDEQVFCRDTILKTFFLALEGGGDKRNEKICYRSPIFQSLPIYESVDL